MKKLLRWLGKSQEDHTQTTIITGSPEVDQHGNPVWNFPHKQVEVPPELQPKEEDTGSFEVLDDTPSNTKPNGTGGFNPYDKGAFNKGTAWGSVKKR